MIMSLVLFENEFLHIVSISFTALILNELIMVALEITTWYVPCLKWLIYIFTRVLRHLYMVISEVVTLFLYAISIAFLPEYFGAFPHETSLSKNRILNLTFCLSRFDVCGHNILRMESCSDSWNQCDAVVDCQTDQE